MCMKLNDAGYERTIEPWATCKHPRCGSGTPGICVGQLERSVCFAILYSLIPSSLPFHGRPELICFRLSLNRVVLKVARRVRFLTRKSRHLVRASSSDVRLPA